MNEGSFLLGEKEKALSGGKGDQVAARVSRCLKRQRRKKEGRALHQTISIIPSIPGEGKEAEEKRRKGGTGSLSFLKGEILESQFR